MAKMSVVNWKKEAVGEVELPSEVFETSIRKDILHTLVKWQLAARRQGTHKTKDRSEVRGGGKKPFKQKGTGNARQGSTRSPLNPGGAVLFGPRPRSYAFALPKKVRQMGLRSALSHLNKEGRLFVIDTMTHDSGKTSELNKKLGSFGVTKAVLIDSTENVSLHRATKNMKNFKSLGVEGMNVYDLLKYNAALISKDSLDSIAKRCGVGV